MSHLLLAAQRVTLPSSSKTAPSLWKQVVSHHLSPWQQLESAFTPVLSDIWEGLWLAVPKSKVSKGRKRNRTKDRVPRPLRNWHMCGE